MFILSFLIRKYDWTSLQLVQAPELQQYTTS